MQILKKSLVLLLSTLMLTFFTACGDDVGNADVDVSGEEHTDDHDDDHDDDHGDEHGDDHSDDHDHANEVMTTLTLTFTPGDGGEAFTATWADPENDGSPVIDDITLTNGVTYTVSFGVLNELEDPAEDITPEITDEMDEHQVFFTGTAVQGPCNTENADAVIDHVYDDTDNNGFPIGLSNTFVAKATGTGVLSVLLRHMPEVNGTPVKTGDLADVMDASGATALPGSTDINVDFNVTVN